MTTNPHIMADEVVGLSGDYQTMSTELALILGRKTVAWAIFRSDSECKSDKMADRQYDATPDGLREMQLRLLMKANEKRASALKTMLRILENESRNTF